MASYGEILKIYLGVESDVVIEVCFSCHGCRTNVLLEKKGLVFNCLSMLPTIWVNLMYIVLELYSGWTKLWRLR